jgi:hypothetical protein
MKYFTRTLGRSTPLELFTEQKLLGVTLTKLYWLLGRKSQLSLSNKLLLYKTIPKPIWPYGIQLWGTASTSNIEILERFQSKALRMTVDTPWYMRFRKVLAQFSNQG